MNNGLGRFIIWRASDNEKLPDVSFIPPMARRRMTDLQKITIGLATAIAPDTPDYNVVFASQFGEWRQTIKLIEQFAMDNEMSPAGFSNSVHNAAVGALAILAKNKNSYTSIAAGAQTLENAILTAATATKPTMVIYADEESPAIYNDYLSAPVAAHGMAFIFDKNAPRKFTFAPHAAELPPLTFDRFAEFLEHGGDIATSTWKITE
ncbi:MAG: beta-ketoacyl synthase chain length factor [Alphaproteobacteria bacterium]|nr:beta-ketoacyl synthase chain length factor [Alphaproteobacteria bacterium]